MTLRGIGNAVKKLLMPKKPPMKPGKKAGIASLGKLRKGRGGNKPISKDLKRLWQIKKTLSKELRREIYKNAAYMPGAESPKTRRLFYRAMLDRHAWQAEIKGKLDSMTPKARHGFLKKRYKESAAVNDKFEIARFALNYGHDDLAVSFYGHLYGLMKIAEKNKIDFYPGKPELSENFKAACWADIYHAMYCIWKNYGASMTKNCNFNIVKNTINAMEPGFKEKVKSVLKDPKMKYKMKESEIMIE